MATTKHSVIPAAGRGALLRRIDELQGQVDEQKRYADTIAANVAADIVRQSQLRRQLAETTAHLAAVERGLPWRVRRRLRRKAGL